MLTAPSQSLLFCDRYAEMFHSGWLSDNDTALIYSYQQNHDSLMRLGVAGGVNVNNAMFGHTAYGTAYGKDACCYVENHPCFTCLTNVWCAIRSDRIVDG